MPHTYIITHVYYIPVDWNDACCIMSLHIYALFIYTVWIVGCDEKSGRDPQCLVAAIDLMVEHFGRQLASMPPQQTRDIVSLYSTKFTCNNYIPSYTPSSDSLLLRSHKINIPSKGVQT